MNLETGDCSPDDLATTSASAHGYATPSAGSPFWTPANALAKASATLLALMMALPAQAQTTERSVAEPAPVYQAKRAKAVPRIDGRLDDAAWRDAASVKLTFPWPEQSGPRNATAVRLLWDDTHLYVAYECVDEDIVDRHTRHDDPTYEDDAVELFINADGAPGRYVGLEINARGVLYDYLFDFPKKLDKSFDLQGVQIAVQRRGTLNERVDKDDGWTLELAIPIANLVRPDGAGKPGVGAHWRINLNRWDGSDPDRRLSMWSDSGRQSPNPHNPQRFGRLEFID